MTHECKRAIRDRNRLYQRFKRTRNINHEDIWRNKAKEVRLTINLAKLRYKKKMMDTLSDPNLAPKKYWSLIKKVYGNKKGYGIPAIEYNNTLLTTSSAKANVFTDFFCEQQTLVEPPGHQLPGDISLTDQTLSSVLTTPLEVSTILKALETGKAHGADGVTNRLLKDTSESTCNSLSELINKSTRVLWAIIDRSHCSLL
jgi:hypothetical protein